MVDLVLRGSFTELVSLVRTDPLCSSLPVGQCRKMMKEMLLANKQHVENQRLLDF